MSNVTIESLQAQLENANAELEKLKAENAETGSALQAAVEEADALKAEKGELQSRLGLLEKELPAPPEVFTYEKKKYQIRGKVNVPGIGSLTALDVTRSKAAQKILVESGSGLIKEVK